MASVGSVASGFLFAAGLYMFCATMFVAGYDCIVWGGKWSQHNLINCSDVDPSEAKHPDGIAPPYLASGAYWAAPIISSFGLVGLNAISWEAVSDEGSFGDGVAVFARIWMLVSLIMLFSGLGTAIWALAQDLSFQKENAWHWGGIMTFVSNLVILASAFLFRLVRRNGDHAI